MKLGIVRLYCGGSGKKGFYNLQEVGFAREMKKYGYQCYIFFPDKNIKTVKEECIENDIWLIFCPAKCIGVHSYYDWNILLDYNLDVIQIGSDNQLFAPYLLSFCRKNKIKHYNYIGVIESNTTNIFKRIIFMILFHRNLNAYHESKCFVKNKKVFKQLKNLNVNNIDIAPVGLDLSQIPFPSTSYMVLRGELHLPLDKKIILFVGRIEKYREPMKLKEILKVCNNSFYYVFIGTGSLNDRFEIMLKEHLSHEQYIWFKEIPNDQIHKFYAASDFYINLNSNEIFGMSILEAMYQGCTVVAIHAPGPEMIIEHGKTGYLAKDIADLIYILKSFSPLDRKTIIEYIFSHFTWSNTAEKIHKWISQTN